MAAGASHCLHGWTCGVSVTAAIRAARRGGTRSCAAQGTRGRGGQSHTPFPAQTGAEASRRPLLSTAGAGRAEGTAPGVLLVEGTERCGGIRPRAGLINAKLY